MPSPNTIPIKPMSMLFTAEPTRARVVGAACATAGTDMEDADGLGGKAVTRSANATDGLDMLYLLLGRALFFARSKQKANARAHVVHHLPRG